ncbi:MAG: AMP-binding protein [Candidatus Omnitrophota bacterium]
MAERRNITTLKEMLYTIGRRYAGKIALQEKKSTGYNKIYYQQMLRAARTLTTRLIGLGLKKTERVALICENRPEWAIVFFAVVSSGGVAVPLDTKQTEAELVNRIRHCEAKIIFVDEELFLVLDKLRSSLPFVETVITLTAKRMREEILCLEEMLQKTTEYLERDVYPDDVALMVYTSGTTSIIKAAELTHANLMFEIWTIDKVLNFVENDRFLSILPLHHSFEITGGLLAPLLCGASVTYNLQVLKSQELITTMCQIRATIILTVPLLLRKLYGRMVKNIKNLPWPKKMGFYFLYWVAKGFSRLNIYPGRRLFRSLHKTFGGELRAFISGAAPLDPAIIKTFEILGVTVLQGYGLTETSPVIAVNTFMKNRIGSVGEPLPGVKVKILPLPGHAGGEILTRGPHIMKGYFRNKELTSEVIRDGWFYTGDIGRLDRHGHLYILGRVKNLIVTGVGKKVYPEEVEEEILKSPYIKELCVMGRVRRDEHKKGSEDVYAVIVPDLDYFKEHNANTDCGNIREVISREIKKYRSNLSKYKWIKDFDIVLEELPKTNTRKIVRSKVAEMIGKQIRPQTADHRP